MRLLLPALLLSAITACNPGMREGSRRSLAGTKFPGLWLEKKDADELRTTGKMESYCPELKKNPDRQITNVRLIEPSGEVYLYDPTVKGGKSEKIGDLTKDGKMVPAGFLKTFANGRDFKATLHDEILNLALEDGAGIDYVRTTRTELLYYYGALKSCRY